MSKEEINVVGQGLIAKAEQLATLPDGGALQVFFEDLEWEAKDLGADASMPLGWVADKIVEVAESHGHKILSVSEKLDALGVTSEWVTGA